jgi:hypothetical protein
MPPCCTAISEIDNDIGRWATLDFFGGGGLRRQHMTAKAWPLRVPGHLHLKIQTVTTGMRNVYSVKRKFEINLLNIQPVPLLGSAEGNINKKNYNIKWVEQQSWWLDSSGVLYEVKKEHLNGVNVCPSICPSVTYNSDFIINHSPDFHLKSL